MKLIRILLGALAALFALAFVLFLFVLAPAVQTWAVKALLARSGNPHGTLGSMSAGFGEVDIEDLNVVTPDFSLSVPVLKAKVPVTAALLGRGLALHSLVAKGWTLTLGRPASPRETPPGSGPADSGSSGPMNRVGNGPQGAGLGGHEPFTEWQLPFDLSVDGVDLEGDILVPTRSGLPPTRIHVLIHGGGLSGGHSGTFAVDASCAVADPGFPVDLMETVGEATVSLEPGRRISHVELRSALSVKFGAINEELTLAAAANRAPTGRSADYSLGLVSDGRTLVSIVSSLESVAGRLAGTWSVDLRDTDIAPFLRGRPVPAFTAKGSGRIDTDLALTIAHIDGRIDLAASRLEALAPAFQPLGNLAAGLEWDANWDGRSIRFERFDGSLAGPGPIATVGALQPFKLDTFNGAVTVADARADWLTIVIQHLPVRWLAAATGPLVISGGDATGRFSVRQSGRGVSIRPTLPLTASALTVQRSGRIVASGLDATAWLSVESDPQGWHLDWKPLSVGMSGRQLAKVEGSAGGAWATNQPVSVEADWKADLDWLGSLTGPWAYPPGSGRSAEGHLTAAVADSIQIEAEAGATGLASGHSAKVKLSAEIGTSEVAFHAPVTVNRGPRPSDVRVDGTWTDHPGAPQAEIRLTGASANLDDLRYLAGVLLAAGLPPGGAGGDQGDSIPFWGRLSGRAEVAFDHLRVGSLDLDEVQGRFTADASSLRLSGGRGRIGQIDLKTAQGAVTYDSSAAQPYSLGVDASFKEVDVGPLFGPPHPGQDPAVEGRFSIDCKMSGRGLNRADLLSNTNEEFHLESTTGIVRLLQTSVADSIPEVSTPVSDTVGSVGTFVGSVFGIKRDSDDSGINPVSATADAVLDFSTQVSEIGCDQIRVTAVRNSGGAFKLTSVEMDSRDERLTGSGSIAFKADTPLLDRPLALDLRLAAGERPAKLLAAAGLLSSEKDTQGFPFLNGTIHLAGSLRQIDGRQWHDLLAAAVKRNPEKGDKAAPGARVSPR